MISNNVCRNLGFIGGSRHLKEVRQRILQLGPSNLPVLITGESGTGKEIAARAIYSVSQRNRCPFIAVNCASLAPSLIESELFGYRQGSFTGASKTKIGLFEAARDGTLFLDEIGELPMELQSKFLRVIDAGEYLRIGETSPRVANVRIISATNRNLEEMSHHGTFRQDLLFRLRGCTITLLPLRERKEDISDLIAHFLTDDVEITPNAKKELLNYDWPGNVRELAMVITTLKTLCDASGTITVAMIRHNLNINESQQITNGFEPYSKAKSIVLREFELEYFTNLLRATNGNISRAAAWARMNRKHLRDKLKVLGLYDKKNNDSE